MKYSLVFVIATMLCSLAAEHLHNRVLQNRLPVMLTGHSQEWFCLSGRDAGCREPPVTVDSVLSLAQRVDLFT
jgi:hypothetical protein